MATSPNKTATLNGSAYLYRIQRGKHGITGLQVGLELADTARFTLRREGELDRLAKWTGLTREWQTRDDEFDTRVYIQSDDARLHDVLTLDARLREGISTLLQTRGVKKIEMDQGVMWVQCSYDREAYGRDSDPAIAERLAAAALPSLQLIKARLAELKTEPWEASRDTHLLRYRVLVIFCIALGIAGFACLPATPGPELPHALIRQNIHSLAAKTAAIVFAVLFALAMVLIGRTSRTHRLLACILFVSTPGAWCAASVYYERQNNQGQVQRPEFKTYVADLREQKNRRSTTYRMKVTIMPDTRMSTSLAIDRVTYTRLQQGQCVHLDIRPGKLGDPWLAGIAPIRCDVGK
jgi:hypothetical protein